MHLQKPKWSWLGTWSLVLTNSIKSTVGKWLITFNTNKTKLLMVHYQLEKLIFLLSWEVIYVDRNSLQTSSTLIYTTGRIYEHSAGNVSASLHCSRYFLIHNAMLYHDMNQRQIMYCSHTWAWDGQFSVSSLDRIQNVYETLKVINYFPSIILFPTGKLSQTSCQSLAISRKYSDERPSISSNHDS